jgi:hypothetical protein
LYVHFNTRKEASLKNRRILVESVLVCLVLLIVTACTPTPPENIYWEPDASGFIRFKTDDPTNAQQGFVKLYDTTQKDPMTPVEVTVKKILGSVGGGFGIVFCALDEQNYFKVLINVAGTYMISRVIAGGDTVLKDWTDLPALLHDYNKENTIKVTYVDVGSKFELVINGALPVTFSASGLTGGRSGFFAWVSTVENEYPAGWVDVRFKMVTPVAIP